jgi:DNA-binding cell septation regulator SpoVG
VNDTDDAETVPVDIRVLEIERTNVGRVRAYAAVEIEVAGISFVVQGIVVSRAADGRIHVDLPTYKRDGRAYTTIVLPDEMVDPVGRLVFEAYRELAWRAR